MPQDAFPLKGKGWAIICFPRQRPRSEANWRNQVTRLRRIICRDNQSKATLLARGRTTDNSPGSALLKIALLWWSCQGPNKATANRLQRWRDCVAWQRVTFWIHRGRIRICTSPSRWFGYHHGFLLHQRRRALKPRHTPRPQTWKKMRHVSMYISSALMLLALSHVVLVISPNLIQGLVGTFP